MVGTRPQTKEYASLMFAYVFARLGESESSRQITRDAIKSIKKRDAIHTWAVKAFGYRIDQALNGDPNSGSLGKELLDAAASMEAFDRYKLDKLRQYSRILEPHERIDACSRWGNSFTDALTQELNALNDVVDRMKLRKTIDQLLRRKGTAQDKIRILSRALELSPRLDETFALELLDLAPDAVDQCKEVTEKTLVLQRAIYVAAHYGRQESVHALAKVFSELLPQLVSNYLQIQTLYNPEGQETIDKIESLFTQSFRGMRKMGMRDEVGKLFTDVAECVAAHEPKSQKERVGKNSKTDGDPARAERLLLCVAGGWYYFGQYEQARAIADRVRDLLFKGDLAPVNQKNLACAYIHAVAQAPVQEAMDRIIEVFDVDQSGTRRVPNVKDILTTSSHFSISQLTVVEAAAVSLVSDDFSISAVGRRWLDEDEFLVRSRLHQDMREATSESDQPRNQST